MILLVAAAVLVLVLVLLLLRHQWSDLLFLRRHPWSDLLFLRPVHGIHPDLFLLHLLLDRLLLQMDLLLVQRGWIRMLLLKSLL